MTAAGRPALPLRQFVLKTHSRCDLACDHCYVYEHADQSWRGRPTVVSDEVLSTTARRIAEHAAAHGLDTVHVVLHGGEPLLAGRPRLRRAAEELTAALHGVCALDLRIHTNAVTLDERFLDLFAEFGIKVGVSLDGDRAANDLHRRYADGRSSHDRVLRGIALLARPRYRHLFAGILCTIDLRNDPVAVYDALTELRPPRVDFLLPHATWDEPPPRPADDSDGTAYARWLLTVHERWTADGRPMDVRVFDSVLRTLRGDSSLTESLGLAPADLAVIETDGTFEQADSLKTAYDGAAATGFDVFTHSLDEVAAHPGIVARQQGLGGLSEQCRACPVVMSCGGGLYAHRYRSGGSAGGADAGRGADDGRASGGDRVADGGFLNPSVYCSDLLRLITEIKEREMGPTSERPEQPERPERSEQSSGRAPLAEQHLDELASGRGSTATVDLLARHQLVLSRELLAHVWRNAPYDPLAEAAWGVLTVLDEEAPGAVDTVLAHPYTRAWALGSLRADVGAAETAGRGLAEIAAAAALRAGHPAEVTVPVQDQVLRLPTLGALTVGEGVERVVVRANTEGHGDSGGDRGSAGDADSHDRHDNDNDNDKGSGSGFGVGSHDGRGGRGDGFAVLVSGRTEFSVVWKGANAPAWRRRWEFELDGWAVALEDTDPWRDCHGHAVRSRLTEAEVEAWRADLTAAWDWIRRELPEYAPGVAAGLRVVTPLSPSPSGADISSAARDAFGAVAIARPAAPETLALLLVHEFQHVKLGAVLDLIDLHDPACDRLFYAPWRPDPRPLEGLLQGTYAHLAVVDFWRARWRAGDDFNAQVQFSRWRDQTAEAIETLASSGALTAAGKRFLTETRKALAVDEVSRAASLMARLRAKRHRQAAGGAAP